MDSTRKNVKQLASDTFYYGLGSGIAKFIAVFKTPILTRIFVPGDYGYFDLLGTTMSFFLMLMGMNLISGIYRYYYEFKDEEKKKSLLSTGFVFALFISIFITILLFTFKPFLIGYLSGKSEITRNHSLFLSLVLLRTPFDMLESFFMSLFRLKRKAKLFLSVRVFQILLDVTLTLAMVVGFKMYLLGAFLSKLITVSVVTSIIIFISRRDIKLSFSFKIFKNIMTYSIPGFFATLINWLFQKMNTFYIFSLCSEIQLGYFSVATKVASFLGLMIMAYRSAWEPYSMELMQRENHKEMYNKFFRYSVIFFGFAAFTISVFSKPVFMIIAPPNYYQAIPLIPLILFGDAFADSYRQLFIGIQISKKTMYMTYAQIIGFIFAVGLNWILIKQFGIIGAASAILPIYMFRTIWGYYFSNKLYKINFGFKVNYYFIFLFATAMIFSITTFHVNILLSIGLSIIIEIIVLLFTYKFVLMKNERVFVENILERIRLKLCV